MSSQEHVTIRLVCYCAAVAVLAYAVGLWVGDYKAKMALTDAALASLTNTVNGHEVRIRSLEMPAGTGTVLPNAVVKPGG